MRISCFRGGKEVSSFIFWNSNFYLEQEFNSITTADKSESTLKLQNLIDAQRLEIENLRSQLSNMSNSESISHMQTHYEDKISQMSEKYDRDTRVLSEKLQ